MNYIELKAHLYSVVYTSGSKYFQSNLYNYPTVERFIFRVHCHAFNSFIFTLVYGNRKRSLILRVFFFSFPIWVFFHEHSRFIGQQGKGEGIYLTPLYHFHPLHRHLDSGRAITAESSPLHISGIPTRTGNLWFPSASR